MQPTDPPNRDHAPGLFRFHETRDWRITPERHMWFVFIVIGCPTGMASPCPLPPNSYSQAPDPGLIVRSLRARAPREWGRHH